MIVLAFYIAAFVAAWLAFGRGRGGTFGDAASVRPNRLASVISVFVLFAVWAAFTGSKLSPLHVPGPFLGETQFTYTAEAPDGTRRDGVARVVVHKLDEMPPAADGVAAVPAWRSGLLKLAAEDALGTKIIAIDGQPITPGDRVAVANGSVTLTPKGTVNFTPYAGWQMEPIWLPPPESVWARFTDIAANGYQNTPLWEHLGFSLFRVLAGFAAGAVVGIPLGYAMGLSSWARGWFDPIVEFMRPVPPLALIPLIIIWFGIWERGKIVLLP
mgnify:CR=1 FL=1